MQLRRAHRRTSPPSARRARRLSGFTLVELLVAISILVILSALVITGIRQDDGDRMSESTRTFQAYIEGARSRAVANQHPVGIRLIPSQNDPRVVDSLVYIAAGQQIEGTVNIAHNGSAWLIVNTNGPLEWARLNVGGRQLIERGNRIELPRGSGHWYAIDAFAPAGTDPVTGLSGYIQLAGHYASSTAVWEDADNDGALDMNEDDQYTGMPPLPPFDNGNGSLDVAYRAEPAVGVPYRMELSPSTLAGADPIQLEPGVVIDLDASQIPASWRPNPSGPQPNAYTARMEIMFDARGNVTGDLVAAGLVHFFLANVGDVELSRARPMHPANPPLPMQTSNRYPFTRDNADTDPRIITIFTQTGQVMTSQALLIDDGTGRADPADMFDFAQYGREAAQ